MNRSEHIITTLAEEGGEIGKECHKGLRFGLDDKVTLNPYGPRGTEGPTNREKIAAEFVDLLGVYLMAVREGLLPDVGLDRLPPEIHARMEAKIERVEAFMRYARRVEAMDHMPKLSTFACFQGSPDHPFQLLMEGPQGFSYTASSETIDGLLLGFRQSARQVWPACYTEATMPKEPTPCYLIHPDYHEDSPPIVTVFPDLPFPDGSFVIQWKDGTKDQAHPENLRPVFAPSEPTEQPLTAMPFLSEDDSLKALKTAREAKEQAMAAIGAKMVEPRRRSDDRGTWDGPAVNTPEDRAQIEGPIRVTVCDVPMVWIRNRRGPVGDQWTLTLDRDMGPMGDERPVFGLVVDGPKGWAWSSMAGQENSFGPDDMKTGFASSAKHGRELVEATFRKEVLVFEEAGQADMEKAKGEGKSDYQKLVEAEDGQHFHPEYGTAPVLPLSSMPAPLPADGEPPLKLTVGVDGVPHGQMMNALAVATSPELWPFGEPVRDIEQEGLEIGALVGWEIVDEVALVAFPNESIQTEGKPFKIRAIPGERLVMAELDEAGKAYWAGFNDAFHPWRYAEDWSPPHPAPEDPWTKPGGPAKDVAPIPTGPIKGRSGDKDTTVNGLRCVWRKRYDGLDGEVWDLLVLSIPGQQWTGQDPILGRVTEMVLSDGWQAEAWGPSYWLSHQDTAEQAREAVETELNTAPL